MITIILGSAKLQHHLHNKGLVLGKIKFKSANLVMQYFPQATSE